MRFSISTAITTALLASNVAAWSTNRQSWSWQKQSQNQVQGQGQGQGQGQHQSQSQSQSQSQGQELDQGSSEPDVKIITRVHRFTKTIGAQPNVAQPTTFVQEAKTSTAAAAPAATTSPASSVSVSSGSLSDDEKKALDAHNAARSDVGVSALEWDDALAADAKSWAEHLTSVGTLTHSGADGQGENLYMSSGTDETPLLNGSNMWIDEKKSYSGQPIDGNFGSYGHYTQVCWKSTTKVGIAVAVDSQGQSWVVARYSPPGNMMGETPY